MKPTYLWIACLFVPTADCALAQSVDELVDQCHKTFFAKRYTEAFHLCQRAATQGSAEAKKGLGMMYHLGNGVARNDVEAVKYLMPYLHTDRLTTYYIADMYQLGSGGLPRDPDKARTLFLESCHQGFSYACMALGEIYEFGDGVRRDRQTAILYYSQAGSLGEAYSSQFARILALPDTPVFRNKEELGEYVGRKIGPDVIAGREPDSRTPTPAPGATVPPPVLSTGNPRTPEELWQAARQAYLNMNHPLSAALARKAALAGHVMAMYQMGYFYETGDGLTADMHQAVKWWQMAADHGSPMAQNALGTRYESGGGGLPEDWLSAAQMWQRSAAQGYAKGEYNLARAYRFGIGVPCDLQTAVEWYEKSTGHGGAGADEVKWLRGNHLRFDGQFIDQHEQAIFNGIWEGNLTVPFGRLFHNHAEREAYLHAAAQNTRRINSEGRMLQYQRDKHDFDECVRNYGSTACGGPPLRPQQ
jgi:TPR repeat protein